MLATSSLYDLIAEYMTHVAGDLWLGLPHACCPVGWRQTETHSKVQVYAACMLLC